MMRKGLIAAVAVFAIATTASAQVSIAPPFNPGGFPIPQPHPAPTVLGNMGFTTPIVPFNGGFFDTGPVFFDQTGTFMNPTPQAPTPVPLPGSAFVPLAPQVGGSPIGSAGANPAGVNQFGPVMSNGNGTGFVPMTNQALVGAAPNGFAHQSPVQTNTGVGIGQVAGGFVAVTPDAVAVQPGMAIPRTSDLIDARILSDGKLRVRWNGWNPAVDYGMVALLDKNRNVIKSVNITSPPLQATFTLTNKSAFYQVVVHYMNGTVTSIVSPV